MDTTCSVSGQRQNATLNHEINQVGDEAKDESSKTSRHLMVSEELTRPKTLQAI